jgi:acyl dehydratase
MATDIFVRKEDLLHYEDFPVGEVFEFGDKLVTKEEIIEFASEFDPQPHHLDENAARASMLGVLSASGWHSCAMQMRMIVDGFWIKAAALGGAGVDETRWMKPVKVGDRLRIRRTTLDKHTSKSKPHMGFLKFRFDMFNQTEQVMETTGTFIVAVRNPEQAS